jgi:hypothetical protein
VSEWHEALGSDPVHTFAAIRRRLNQSGGLQQLQMLHDSAALDRQASRKLAGRHRRASEALKNNEPQRMSK